ncbi:MAG: LptA/OstA family protein [Phormidesmis sp.]
MRPKLIGAFAIALMLSVFAHGLLPTKFSWAEAQSGGALQLKASRVEANSNTGVVTAIGNVRIDYPSRQIFATSAQAQYYSREQRIVLSGNVDVVQEGNTLQAETVTYLIEEGRFVATPGANSQVEAVYILPEDPSPAPSLESQPTTPAPIPIPAVPDEIPADLSSINRP